MLKLYVDDLTLALKADPAELIRKLVTIIEFVVFYLGIILGMEVSRNKSNVVASSPAIAVAISQGVKNNVVKPAFHAKLLGCDFVGGARRSTIQFQVRHGVFRCMRPQFLALRNAGVEVQQMARRLALRCSSTATNILD